MLLGDNQPQRPCMHAGDGLTLLPWITNGRNITEEKFKTIVLNETIVILEELPLYVIPVS